MKVSHIEFTTPMNIVYVTDVTEYYFFSPKQIQIQIASAVLFFFFAKRFTGHPGEIRGVHQK